MKGNLVVKENKHQNTMSSVLLKQGVRFIDLLGYRDIPLKGDTEPAIIAFRCRVAEICKAEAATEDAVKGDKPSHGLIENTVMVLRGIIRTMKCHFESCARRTRTILASPATVDGTYRQHTVQVSERSRRENTIKDCTASHKNLSRLVRKCR